MAAWSEGIWQYWADGSWEGMGSSTATTATTAGTAGGRAGRIISRGSAYYPTIKEEPEDPIIVSERALLKKERELVQKQKEALKKQESLDHTFKESLRLQLIALWDDIAKKESEIQVLREKLLHRPQNDIDPQEEAELLEIYLMSRADAVRHNQR